MNLWRYFTINSNISECDHKCETRNAEPEIGTNGSSQTRQNPWVEGYRSGFGPPRVSGSDFWTGLEPYLPIFTVQTWTAGGLPGLVANTRCGRGIQSHYMTISQATMTCSIIWMVLCELSPRRRLNRRTTCFLLWSLFDRSCPNIMLKWLQWQVCLSFWLISSILSGSCDHVENRTKEWILILRTRHSILPNTMRPFWSMWRMNTVSNIKVYWSMNSKAYRGAISSPPQPLQHPVNQPLIHMSCPAMMKNTECQKCGSDDTRTKWSRITHIDCHQALFECATWSTTELGANESKSQWLPLWSNRDQQYILNARHNRLVVPTRGNALKAS